MAEYGGRHSTRRQSEDLATEMNWWSEAVIAAIKQMMAEQTTQLQASFEDPRPQRLGSSVPPSLVEEDGAAWSYLEGNGSRVVAPDATNGRLEEGESWLRERPREPSCDSEEEPNIEFDLVCDSVPVVGLYESNEFYEHVSSMLQAAVGSSGKADSLYETCGDRRVLSACSDLGLSEHEVQVARLTDPNLRHVKAAGTSGRHSVKLALVVAVVLDGSRELRELYSYMRYYKLEEAFSLLTSSARESTGGQRHDERAGGQRHDERAGGQRYDERAGGQRHDERAAVQPHEEQYDDDGVDLRIVSGPTPVVGLLKSSPLHEHASWLLQIATGGTGKAAALYEYVDRGDDAGILGECQRLGLASDEVGLVRIKQRNLQHVMAVGTCGNRSIMLSAALALVLRGEARASAILEQAKECDSALEKALGRVFGRLNSQGGSQRGADRAGSREPDSGGRTWGSGDRAPPPGGGGRKRRREFEGRREVRLEGGGSRSRGQRRGREQDGRWRRSADRASEAHPARGAPPAADSRRRRGRDRVLDVCDLSREFDQYFGRRR